MSLSFSVMQCLNCLFVEVFIKFALIQLEIISDIGYKLSLDLSLIQVCLIRIYSIVLHGLGNSFLTIILFLPFSGDDQQEINLSPCRLFSQHLWDQSQDSEKTIELLVYEGERERGGEFCNLLANTRWQNSRESVTGNLWRLFGLPSSLYNWSMLGSQQILDHIAITAEQSSLILKLHIIK